MASETRRKAAGIIVKLIDGWWAKHVDHRQPDDPGEELDTRVELLRLKETFERVEKAVDDPRPEGWTEGNPAIGVCSCNTCVDRRTAAKRVSGEMKDPD